MPLSLAYILTIEEDGGGSNGGFCYCYLSV